MNQAQRIRQVVLNLLENYDMKDFKSSVKLEEIETENGNTTYGVKYIDLKNSLRYESKYSDEFTEGGIVGALNTLDKRVDEIQKVRNKKGVYFYYKEINKEKDDAEEAVTLINSKEFRVLEKQVQELSITVNDMLRNANSNVYVVKSNNDLRHFRDILNKVEALKGSVMNYKHMSAIDSIKVPSDDLPF